MNVCSDFAVPAFGRHVTMLNQAMAASVYDLYDLLFALIQ
jgi:hypothetical protein